MNEAELNYLRQYAATLGDQFGVEATVSYDSNDGLIVVDAIGRAGAATPRSIRRSGRFESREQAEALIDQVVRAASAF
jgi:hypothetical protein